MDYLDSIEYDKHVDELNKFIFQHSDSTHQFKETTVSDLKIGDKIFIEFYPFSQKYVFMLYPKYGTIIEIIPFDDLNSDSNSDICPIENIIISNDKISYSISHGFYGYFNNTRSYDFIIKKLNLI